MSLRYTIPRSVTPRIHGESVGAATIPLNRGCAGLTRRSCGWAGDSDGASLRCINTSPVAIAAYVVWPQPFSALPTALTSRAISTWPSGFWNARHALAGWLPSAMLTPVMSSLIETTWLSSQSPVHGGTVAVGVGFATRVGATVDVVPDTGVCVGGAGGKAVLLAVPLAVGTAVAKTVAVAVRETVEVALGADVGDETVVGVAADVALRVRVGVAVVDEDAVPVAVRLAVAVAEVVAVAVREAVAVALGADVADEVAVDVAVGVRVGVAVLDEEAVRVAVRLAVAVAVTEPVAVTVREAVDVALGADVADQVAVDVAVWVRVRVGVGGTGVGDRLGDAVGVGDVSENGAENGDVLWLMSVAVAVMCGPLSGPLKVQLASLVVKTVPSKTRPSSSESEKMSTAHGTQAVPWSGAMPSIVGGARLSLPPWTSAIPAAPFA